MRGTGRKVSEPEKKGSEMKRRAARCPYHSTVAW